MPTYKEQFDFLKEFCKKYTYLVGWGLFELDDNEKYILRGFDGDNHIVLAGLDNESLIIEAFNEGEYEWRVTEPGFYEFHAILSYSPAQIGDYPPPNIEVAEYMMIEYIEYKKTEN